jgi:hypothetical protein
MSTAPAHIINKNPGAMVVATGARTLRIGNNELSLQHIDGGRQA